MCGITFVNNNKYENYVNNDTLYHRGPDNCQNLTVNYNCGPGLNNPNVLTLCGSGEMHPQADNVGLINSVLVYPGEGHTWFVGGNSNSKFTQLFILSKIYNDE